MIFGNGEKAGSGADIIKKGWIDNKWPQPVLSERVQPDEILMTLVLEGEEDVGKEQNGSKVGTKDGTKEVSERQKLILELVQEDGTITIPQLIQKTEISRRTILRELAVLQENGLLTREGGRKNGRWVVFIPE